MPLALILDMGRGCQGMLPVGSWARTLDRACFTLLLEGSFPFPLPLATHGEPTEMEK